MLDFPLGSPLVGAAGDGGLAFECDADALHDISESDEALLKQVLEAWSLAPGAPLSAQEAAARSADIAAAAVASSSSPSPTPSPAASPQQRRQRRHSRNRPGFAPGQWAAGGIRLWTQRELTLERLLGEGFYSRVYLARARGPGAERLAVKEFKSSMSRSDLNRFLQEFGLQRALFHPHVLAFKGIYCHDSTVCLVTEYAPNGTLLERIVDEERPLSARLRFRYLLDVARGMEYLHQNDIIHRDLKSENCLLKADDSVLVCDFGLSRRIFERKLNPQRARLRRSVRRLKRSASGGEGEANGEAALPAAEADAHGQRDGAGSGEGAATPRPNAPTTVTVGGLLAPPPHYGSAAAPAAPLPTGPDAARDPAHGASDDEGAAQEEERLIRYQNMTTKLGTAYYMAPEMFQGGDYDHSVDVFSFGIVCAEVCARQYADPDILPRTAKLVNGEFCFGLDMQRFGDLYGANCPPELLQLTSDCCSMDPHERPSFRDIVARLEALLAADAGAGADDDDDGAAGRGGNGDAIVQEAPRPAASCDR